ncbi:MAG: HAMP domain-containing histidine kinase [Candidatus Vogelbacteria bacterium]|nr:HAMP domain-containing histidine kinase [Candidatus Vogelbacteria bacterium]
MKKNKNKLGERDQKIVGEIDIANERMIRLVGSLLNVSRLEMGTVEVKSEPVDIIGVVNNIINELTPEISDRMIEVKKNYDKNIPTLSGDSSLYGIIFQNLIANSVKYTRSRGEIDISLNVKDGRLVFEVEDNGFGIPRHQQSEVFKKLFGADNARTIETDGTGLGLYIAKSILDIVGGSIRFESEENRGTTFHVELPIKGIVPKQGTTKLMNNLKG